MLHIVEQGECLSSIAQLYGFRDYWIVYNHARNAGFRRKRPDPNIIYPGDSLYIPDKAAKAAGIPTGKRHTFRVPVPKRILRLRFLDAEGKPIASTPVALNPEGEPQQQKMTDGDGQVEFNVKPVTRGAGLKLGSRVLQIHFSHLNPVDETPDGGLSGIQARLQNLGYYSGPIGDELDRRTRVALVLFQHDHDLEMDGKPNSATVQRLIKEHGC